jgi:hypothetical protein
VPVESYPNRDDAASGAAPAVCLGKQRPAILVRDAGSEQVCFDYAKTYKATLPEGTPELKYWSFSQCDKQTRAMLDTPRYYLRTTRSYACPRGIDADGLTTVYFGPTRPPG